MSPVGWACGIPQLHLCIGVRPPPHTNKYSANDTKQSDGEDSVILELWECTDCIPSRNKTSSPKKRCLRNGGKLHSMVKLQFWSFGEGGIHLHCHYSQLHSVPKW